MLGKKNYIPKQATSSSLHGLQFFLEQLLNQETTRQTRESPLEAGQGFLRSLTGLESFFPSEYKIPAVVLYFDILF